MHRRPGRDRSEAGDQEFLPGAHRCATARRPHEPSHEFPGLQVLRSRPKQYEGGLWPGSLCQYTSVLNETQSIGLTPEILKSLLDEKERAVCNGQPRGQGGEKPPADHRASKCRRPYGSRLPLTPWKYGCGCLREIGAPDSTRRHSLRNAEFVPDVITGPRDPSIQIGDSFFDALPLNNQPREIRPCRILRQFVNEPPRFLFDGCGFRHRRLTCRHFITCFSAPFPGACRFMPLLKLGNKLGTISAKHHQKPTRIVQDELNGRGHRFDPGRAHSILPITYEETRNPKTSLI